MTSTARKRADVVSHAAGFFGNAVSPPLLKCGDERVLGQFFGGVDITHQPDQAVDDAG
jgi:hypothetical protein